MIDITQEELLLFSDLPGHLPKRNGKKPVHLSACYRWKNQGISGVRLETVFVAGNRYTSKEAVNRFWEAVTIAKDKKQVRQPKPQAKSDSQLEAAGW